ncbi:hypothetical protein FKR81_19380 [Lentzea tibetensis]|uniref:Uncharacterized protein n=1 Tax=Lentzea tibetensis TaxID=2591470 RepID=A0A563ESX1_9PSEU|nr:hypothetical protein [Lentzea tibetensis]TWP50766.1 hypothetical protein FKR81_19380 [Lentzea tibetensis]
MDAQGWPFLVARGRRRGYSVLLAPPPLMSSYGLLEDVARPTSGIAVATVRGLCVVWSEHAVTPDDIGAEPRDEHSRPLRLLHGFVTEQTVTAPSEVDMSRSLTAALDTYRRFLDDEERFTVERSASFPAHSDIGSPAAIGKPDPRPRRYTVPALAAGAVLVGAVIFATSGNDPEPPKTPSCPTTTAPTTHTPVKPTTTTGKPATTSLQPSCT